MRRIGIGLALALTALALVPAGANGATITVAVTDDAQNGGFDDTGCTLRDAILAANINGPTPGTPGFGCPGDSGGGTGIDTILLQGGLTYALSLRQALDEDAGTFGDLDVTGGGGTIIRATGSGLATIDAGNTTFPGPADNQRERVLDILPGAGGVTLEGIKVTGGVDNESPAPGTAVQGGDGSGIQSLAQLTLINSEVSGNSSGDFGGGANFGGAGILIRTPGGLTLNGSTVANNTLRANAAIPNNGARGGGISYYSSSAPFVATNSTISGNSVDSLGHNVNTTGGGAIEWFGPGQTMTLTNVTISGNQAIGGGGNVVGGGLTLGTPGARLDNTILAGNTAATQADCFKFNAPDSWTSLGDNIVGDNSGCGVIGGSNDLFSQNPNLGALSNYGGNTRTMLPNPGSPAINRGGICPATDQRGFFRAPVAPCDAGAVELNAPATFPQPPPAGPTGQRAAALKKCKKKRSKKARKKCRAKAALLPI